MTDNLDLDALAGYLRGQGVAVSGDLTATQISGGRSNLTYRLHDDATAWLLRRPPLVGRTASAHDVAREFRVCSGLYGTDVPIAEPVLLCEDEAVIGTSFTVTAWVPSVVIRDSVDLDPLDDAQLNTLVDELVRVLGALHAVDVAGAGLETFGKPQGFLNRQVALWRRQWENFKTRDLADLERLHGVLEQHVPEQGECTVVHGDYRVDNTLLEAADPTKVLAVVDWEMSTLGDPLADVALMCTYRNSALDVILSAPAAWTSPRLPDMDALAQQYAKATGRELRHWPFHIGLAHFKLAVIAEGIAYRALAGSDPGGGGKAAEVVPPLVAAGLRYVSGHGNGGST
jgi:aminoglycoside phosphotransferase (APT) family kinase protein